MPGMKQEEIDLYKATLFEIGITDANTYKGDLRNFDLLNKRISRRTNLQGADLTRTNLQGAILEGAILKRAILNKTVLSGTELYNVDLSGALYAPTTAPAQGNLSGLFGLRSVTFCPNENGGLVLLRAALRKLGARDEERAATYALERVLTRHLLDQWDPTEDNVFHCVPFEQDRVAAIEGALRLVFFEWTTGYGLYYGRPIWILIGLICLFSVPYMSAVIDPTHKRGGIWIIWPKHPTRPGREKERKIRLVANGLAVVRWGLYFSLLSAFRIGWRDLNVGSWLTQLQQREYALRARGGVRGVSGAQSLFSLYLIAMWVLTYFGRPFE